VNSPEIGQPTLRVNYGSSSLRLNSVSIRCLGPGLADLLARAKQPADLLRSIFRVTVVLDPPAKNDDLPSVSGRYAFGEDEIHFVPTFPFERDVRYRARFDPSGLEKYPTVEPATLDFAIPSEDRALEQTSVTEVFPSGGVLPENLLRFYVHFSNSMQRGRALEQISLLDSFGHPVADAVYRAPAELWDCTMRRLTVLLDPGRLKRWVGPNLALGPPLKAGQRYILEISRGMNDQYGRPLREPYRKHFFAGEPVREPIALKDWQIHCPATGSRQPLALTFLLPLDRALALDAIRIESEHGSAVQGHAEVDQCETRWNLKPASPWTPGIYHVRVNSRLEDVCGNTPTGAFERPLGEGPQSVTAPERSSLVFRLT
jgi:hypothetical protein